MNIIKWEPLNEIDRFFEDSPILSFKNYLRRDFEVDLYEEGENIIVKINLPGIDLDNLHLSIDDNLLKISGSRDEEKEKKGKNYYSREIRYGSFERFVSIPHSVQKDKVSAEYDRGVLVVTLPKSESDKSSSKIEVKIKK